MKILLITIACVLAPFAALSAQRVSLVATSGLNSSGTLCDPFTCAPATITAARGYKLGFTLAGAVGQPHFLIVGLPPAHCVSVPGINGSLIVQPQGVLLLPLTWGRIFVSGGAPVCASWMGFGSVLLPPNSPAGAQLLMQVITPVWAPGGPQWTFSNAVELTIQ